MVTPLWDYFPPEELVRLQEVRKARLSGISTPPSSIPSFGIRTAVSSPSRCPQNQISIDGRTAVVSFVFDVSHRKRAEQALRESDARFRTLIENAPDGVAILRGAAITFLNPIAARMLGITRYRIRSWSQDYRILAPRRRGPRGNSYSRAGDDWAPAPRTSRVSLEIGRRARLVIEISSIPLQVDGAPAVLAFARDITERRAMQARLVEADRLAALGVLSAGVAHEINNPLAYALLNLGFLARELPSSASDPDKLQGLVDRMRRRDPRRPSA